MANPRFGDRLSRALVQYYVALRVSASAATERWPLEPIAQPPAIVRLRHTEQLDGFDAREVWTTESAVGVVTLPVGQGGVPHMRGFSPN